MAATSTTFGSGVWGIDSAETGIIIESISINSANSMKELKDRTGNTNTITYYDEKLKISLKGRLPETSPFSTTIAATTTVANIDVGDYLKGGITGAAILVENVTVDLNNEDYQAIAVDITVYPNVSTS